MFESFAADLLKKCDIKLQGVQIGTFNVLMKDKLAGY